MAERSASRLGWLRLPAVVLVAVLLGAGLVKVALPRLLAPDRYHGTVFPVADPAPPFTGLTTVDGKPASLASQRGKVVIVFFGYLSCPDVCPTTMATLARTMDLLGDDADRVQVYMVSVDPARDTPQELETYVDQFDPRFAGLAGSAHAIATAATRYGIYVKLHPPDAAGNYVVDHTASLTGVDTKGRLKIVWSYRTKPAELADDIRTMLPG